ncbi:MAG: ABC transporter permease [Alphaproteobacteria bacterium]|nr:ABC transporter permease [Alphaproteobacteria bacterium]
MLLELEKRKQPSRSMLYLTPVIAVLLTMFTGGVIFTLLGYDGFAAVWKIFVSPAIDIGKWTDLGIKAAPLILIATGLSIGFRANVWNIGAEGQYVMGGLAATGVALATWHLEGIWILPLMCLGGIVGGMLYAGIPAFLKTRLNVNEILSSLMLTYAAIQLLYYLMRGPWKDPDGFNFPQTRLFNDSQMLPEVAGTYIHIGVPLAFVIAIAVWYVLSRTVFGFEIRVVGAAPEAARYGGFNKKRTVWFSLFAAGGLAGLAGTFEVAGPFGQMVPQFPTGYGFTAIIVAFLGRLHPIGVILAGIILAISYVGGEIAQTTIGLPSAATGVFQAMMLFFLLATDILVNYRLRIGSLSKGTAA